MYELPIKLGSAQIPRENGGFEPCFCLFGYLSVNRQLEHMMASDTRIRKPITKLTLDELRQYPLWEYALDEEGIAGQDETWVRPVLRNTVPKNAYSQQVHSQFTTPSGVVFEGLMNVNTDEGTVEIIPGAIVGPQGYLVIPSASREDALANDYDWCVSERDALLTALDRNEVEIFPIRYRLNILIAGEKDVREGEIP